MTAKEKQDLFQEVVKANADMFKNKCIQDAESYCYNSKASYQFINYSKEEIRRLAVDYFRLKLQERSHEMAITYLTGRIEP